MGVLRATVCWLLVLVVAGASESVATRGSVSEARAAASVRETGSRSSGSCAWRRAAPLRASAIQRVLRKHGFSAKILDLCKEGALATIANASGVAQGAEERKADEEGFVACTLNRRPLGKLARHPRTVYEYKLPTGVHRGRTFLLANLYCDLYFSPVMRRDAVKQLRASMQELRRSIPR